jgi:hypothetical protein
MNMHNLTLEQKFSLGIAPKVEKEVWYFNNDVPEHKLIDKFHKILW